MSRARPYAISAAAELIYTRSRYDLAGDINQDLWILREYASRCDSVVELGVRSGVSTAAFLAAQPARLLSIDLDECKNLNPLMLGRGRTKFTFVQGDDLILEPAPCELLFIDTLHTYTQLAAELRRWAPLCSRYIALHDTISFGAQGEDGSTPGLIAAYRDYIAESGQWREELFSMAQNGLTVLRRI